MKNILWVSRHTMTTDQLAGLVKTFGEVKIAQLSASPANVHIPFTCSMPELGETVADTILVDVKVPLKELVQDYDEVCAVLPIGLLQQLLPFVPSKRLLQARNKRVLLEEGAVSFVFDGWEQVLKVEVVTLPL